MAVTDTDAAATVAIVEGAVEDEYGIRCYCHLDFAIHRHTQSHSRTDFHMKCVLVANFFAHSFFPFCHLVFIYIYFIRHTKGLLFSYLLKEFCSLNSVKEISKPKTFIWGELIISLFSALLLIIWIGIPRRHRPYEK